MFTTGLMDLHRAGKVTNASKGIFDGVSVTTFALGSAELYRWLDLNAEVAFLDVAAVNDPTVISRNTNLVSINGALSVDLYGQVVADSIDGRQISGVGGHEDFVAGAELHPDAHSLICLRSTVAGRTWSCVAARISGSRLPEGSVRVRAAHHTGVVIHRVRRGRAGRADRARAGPRPGRHRPPRLPGRVTPGGRPPRLSLTSGAAATTAAAGPRSPVTSRSLMQGQELVGGLPGGPPLTVHHRHGRSGGAHPPADPPLGLTPRAPPCPHTEGMSITDYPLTNGLLIALVIRQIHGRRITPWSLIWPLGLVLYFGYTYIHGYPTAGNDLWLTLGGPIVGITLGLLCGIFTRVTPDGEGQPFAKAGLAAALLWIVGVGSRLAFEVYATHGGGGAIGRFSVSHDITTAAAWTTGLVLMALAEVLGRNGMIGWRSYRVRRRGPGRRQRPPPVPAPLVEGLGHH